MPRLSSYSSTPPRDQLVLAGDARAARAGSRACSERRGGHELLAPTLEAFFTERLIGQRRASLQTVACYRDAFRLLLAFASERNGTALVPAAAGGPGRSADPRWNTNDPLRPRLP
jgi:hypothetical protein